MVDVLIITALYDELKALKAVDEGAVDAWTTEKDRFGYRYYRRGYATQAGVLQVAVVPAEDMGGDATIEAALRTIPDLKPACLAMCGICAGRRGDCALGDVIVADKVFRYDVGKVKNELDAEGHNVTRFFTDTETYKIRGQWKQAIRDTGEDWLPSIARPLSLTVQGNWLLAQLAQEKEPRKHPEVKERVPNWNATLEYLRGKELIGKKGLKILAKGKRHIEQVLTDHRDDLPDDPPFRVHLAPIASGSQVVQDETIFHRIITQVRKTLGLEMEAAAIGRIAAMADIPAMLIAKGVSDHADQDKDDSFRHFAARASAEFLLHFLRHTLTPHQATTPEPAPKTTTSKPRNTGSGERSDRDKKPPPKSPHPELREKALAKLVGHFSKSYWQPLLARIWKEFKGDDGACNANRLAALLIQRSFPDVPAPMARILKSYCLGTLRQHPGADTQARDLFEDSEDMFGWLVVLEVAGTSEDRQNFKDHFHQDNPLVAMTLAGLEILFKWSHGEKAEFQEGDSGYPEGKLANPNPFRIIEPGLELVDHLHQLAEYLFTKMRIDMPPGADVAVRLRRVNKRIAKQADLGDRLYLIVNRDDLGDSLNTDRELYDSLRKHLPDLPILYYRESVEEGRSSIEITCDEEDVCAAMGVFFKARRDCLDELAQRRPHA